MNEEENKEVENKEPYLEEEEIQEGEQPSKFFFPWKSFLIVFGIILTLIIVCVIVILCNGGFYQW